MRLAHISDIHIRNLKYHEEYRTSFSNLYEDLRTVKPDIIVNTGDTVHSKTNISPELVEMVSEHFRICSDIAPLYVILGNHDLNLMNPDRQDAVTPIVESLRGSTRHPIFLLKKSGKNPILGFPGYYFFVYSLADHTNYPTVADTFDREKQDDVHIALFHGSIINCMTDQDWKMTSAEQDITIFGACDYVLMGDIHKHQFFGYERKIAYAGSLIQQNFGEDTKKGYLLWDINGKKHTVNFREVRGSRKFYTIRLNDDATVPEMEIDVDSRVRIISPKNFTLIEQKDIEREVRHRYNPKDVISVTSPDTSFSKRKDIATPSKDIEDIRSLSVQDKLIRKFFVEKKIDEKVLEKIAEINKRYQVEIENGEEVVRNVSWKVNKIGWTNMFSYGEENVIDFNKIPGLTGIFAPNTTGKSSIFEIFMESLFDKVTKEVSKNIELINDNRDEAKMVVDMTVGGQDYVIERNIERIKYGQRKSEIKETGKMSLDFYLDQDGDRTSLNGTTRSETESSIRKHIGTFEDFVLTTISPQEPIQGLPGGANLILCKETDRRKILFRFLDLDIFDEKCAKAKEESKQYVNRFKELEESNVIGAYSESLLRKTELEQRLEQLETKANDFDNEIEELDAEIARLNSSLVRTTFVQGDREKIASSLIIAERSKQKTVEKIDALNTELTRLAESISDTEDRLNEYNEKQITEDAVLLAALHTNIIHLENKIDKLSSKISDKKKKLKLLDEVPCGTQYLGCKFLIDAFDTKKSMPADNLEVDLLKKKLLDARNELFEKSHMMEKQGLFKTLTKMLLDTKNEKQSVQVAALKLSNDLDFQKRDIDKMISELQVVDDAEASIERNKELTSLIQMNEKKRSNVKQELLLLTKQVSSLHQQYGAENSLLERLEQSMNEVTDLRLLCSAYENYIEAMGKYGIPYRILTEKLPNINDEINKILSNVVNFSVFLEHDLNEQTIRLYLQYGDYRSRNLGLASGAEKFISSLAIRAALLNVSSLPKTNMFIVDEGFGKLDTIHLESIQRMFDYLRSVFDHVIIISHVDTLKDMVDNNIEISSDIDGYAHVCVE